VFSVSHFLKSFKFAFKGLFYVWQTEQNFRFQILTAIVIIALGVFLNFSLIEFILLVNVILFVLVAEVVNTVLEKLLDSVHPEWNPAVKTVKDISAAVVLIVAIGSIVVGVLLFLPYIIK
jgi:diacylglycerol kinase